LSVMSPYRREKNRGPLGSNKGREMDILIPQIHQEGGVRVFYQEGDRTSGEGLGRGGIEEGKGKEV